ncbi:MAG TPA: acyl-phosphate glycerol 3-phosphate acyltransferase [Methylophilaceae bacterium]|jgi:glycerol-3-phosphate acyltransferase PlsY|nr:acyl-phosphate glycerol 3-phosphate acyltransferase [Methylophilaceae bacterium]HCC72650.1 acyl-phosphate glycerol 3-phosphate acyltransferase [Methylophilaceae bacterium]
MMNAIYILFSYLMGAISFGILMSHLFSLPDPRTIGSKNPGATNVLRTGKKLAALLTLLGDALKGTLTVGLAQYFELAPMMVGLIAIATLIGHIFPIYYGFKGGKGVATAAGMLFMFSWVLGLTVLAVWIAVFMIWRYSSLAAIIAGSLSPVIGFFYGIDFYELIASSIIALILILRHIENIKRLMNGTESGFKDKK